MVCNLQEFVKIKDDKGILNYKKHILYYNRSHLEFNKMQLYDLYHSLYKNIKIICVDYKTIYMYNSIFDEEARKIKLKHEQLEKERAEEARLERLREFAYDS